MTKLELAMWQLGPRANYILKDGDKQFLMEWALLTGHEEVAVNAMTAVDLANLYCEVPEDETGADDIQRATSAAIMATIRAMLDGALDQDTIRAIVRDEVERVAPRQLQIITPHRTVALDERLHYKTEHVIRTAAIDNAIMLVGPAGCGKTTIGAHVAKALQLAFSITSTITDTFQLTGHVDGYGKYHSTPFRQAYEHGGVWIADEIDAWDASALLAANSALANGFCNFPDSPAPITGHPDFKMIATANTFGTGADRVYVGRNELDAASLDRFATINVDYDLQLETMFAAGADRWLEHVWSVRRAVMEAKIRHVVSSRAISKGARALSAGHTWEECEEMYLFKGMSERDREKIKFAIP